MIPMTRLAAAFAFTTALTAAGAASAQTQAGSAAPASAPAQPAPPPAQSTPPSAQPGTSPAKPSDPDFSQPTYSVNPPPDTPSGLYLPAVIGGYAKSVAGCVVVGCNDGPQVGGAPAPAEPPPTNPRPSDPH